MLSWHVPQTLKPSRRMPHSLPLPTRSTSSLCRFSDAHGPLWICGADEPDQATDVCLIKDTCKQVTHCKRRLRPTTMAFPARPLTTCVTRCTTCQAHLNAIAEHAEGCTGTDAAFCDAAASHCGRIAIA